MPLNVTVKFHTGHGYYAFRVWESGVYDTGFLKIPDSFWKSIGHETPRALPASERARKTLEQLAVGWAAKECDRRAELLADRAAGRMASAKLNLRGTFALYQDEGRQKVAADTRKRDQISFDAIARHIDVDEVLPGDVDEPMLQIYVNARKTDKVLIRGKEQKLLELDKTVRHRTVNNELNLLERVVRFARRWESKTGCTSTRFPDEDALRDIRLAEQDSTQVALTEEQLGELLQVVSTPWKRQVIIAGVCTRLREDNLFRLRGEWIDWANASIHIPAEFMKKGRSEKARALDIPVSKIAMEQFGSPRLQGFIWTNKETSQPFTRIYDLADLCVTAGVPPISEHDLRTTGNTLLHTHGVDHLTRKALMGHSTKTGDVTDLYTKVMQQKMREACDILDEIFARVLRPGLKVVDFGSRSAG